MTHKIIDDMDLSFYPIQQGMNIDTIKAVTPSEILDGAMVIAKNIKKSYKGTPYKVDMKIAKKCLAFICLLKHTGGSLAGVPFRLLPFQVEFVVQVLAVINREKGLRKHKEVIMFIPRKNGKTEMGAALNLLMLFLDKEPQKEIYSVAAETQQAAILYHAAVSMMKQSPSLSKKVKQYKAEKKLEVIGGEFLDLYRVLSAIAGTKDGLKTSTLFADEPHAYPDDSLYTVVYEGMAHRAEPLAFLLSTAGYNKQGFFYKKLSYARQVMEGIIDDSSTYLMDFSLDEDDDWTDETLWKKANPAMGLAVKMDYLRDKYTRASHSATEEVAFKTKHINLFVDSAVTWIRSKDWNASNKKEISESELIGRECYAGLDLSSTTDLTAFVLVFPNPDGSYDILPRFFIPEDTAAVRSREDKVSYQDWEKDGYLTYTGGNIIDYEYLYHHIMQDVEKFQINELSFDRWGSTQLITKLTEQGVNCVGFGMGFKSMSSPTKAIESLVLQGKINHGNNPVLSWCVNNVMLISDPAENVKMDKSKSIERIDGAVALAMGIGRAEDFREPDIDPMSLIG